MSLFSKFGFLKRQSGGGGVPKTAVYVYTAFSVSTGWSGSPGDIDNGIVSPNDSTKVSIEDDTGFPLKGTFVLLSGTAIDGADTVDSVNVTIRQRTDDSSNDLDVEYFTNSISRGVVTISGTNGSITNQVFNRSEWDAVDSADIAGQELSITQEGSGSIGLTEVFEVIITVSANN